LAVQNLEQDAPRTDWDRMSQPHEKKWRLIRADALEKRPCLRSQERFEGVVCGVEGLDEVTQENEGGGGVEEGVVPGFFGDEGADLIAEAELIADGAERVVGQVGPCGAGKQKGIDPRAEAVTGEGPQKAFFGALAVGDDNRAGEAFFQLGPERKQGRRVGKILGPDAVNLACRPLDRPIGVKVRNEGISVPAPKRPGHQPDLHRGIGHAGSRTRRFEIDGGEEALVEKFHGRLENQESREEAVTSDFLRGTSVPRAAFFSMFD